MTTLAALLTRRHVRLGLTVVAVMAMAAAALAYFTSHGSATASASVGTISPATISAPSSTNSQAVTITWTGQAAMTPASQNSGITYTVQRKLGSGSYSTLASGGCSGSLPYGTSSCTDMLPSSPLAGTYTYQCDPHAASGMKGTFKVK